MVKTRQPQLPPPHNDIGDDDTLSHEDMDRVHARSPSPVPVRTDPVFTTAELPFRVVPKLYGQM